MPVGRLDRTYSGDRTRTCDPLINSQLLYQLSYAGSAGPYYWGSGRT